MPGTSVRHLHWLCTTCLSSMVAVLLAGPVLAQAAREKDTDLADQVRRMDKVAAQKLEAEMRQALRDAERLARSDTSKAAQRLQKALALLEDDTVLAKERRDSLKRMLTDLIRITQQGPDTAADKEQEQLKTKGRRVEDERRAAEQEKVRQGLKNVNKLKQDGKAGEASREAGDLAERHPNQPAVQASNRTTSAAEQLANARKLQKEKERSLLGAFRDTDRSATLPKGDIEFPKDWKERTKYRKSEVQLTAKEKELLRTLNSTISVDFKNFRFDDVIEYLQTYLGQPILVDKESLKDADTSYDTPVTLKLKGVTARTVLRKILADQGLTYVIRNETIQVTSPERAKEMMVVRKYYIGDLLANLGDLGPLGQLGLTPLANAANAAANAAKIIEMIEDSVDPQSWRKNGGNGTITYHAPSMSLIIKQSAEVHGLMGNSGSIAK